MGTFTQNSQLTLVEVSKRVADGKMLQIAEILQKSRPCIGHAPMVEANEMFSNVTTQRFSLPAGSFRKFNAGTVKEASQTKQIRDTIGMLEARAEHDKDLVDSMPSPSQYRNDENVAFIEGLGQTMSYTLWYGNALTEEEKWTGFAPRMSALNGKTVQGCGGTGSDLSSIYFVDWRPDRTYMTYPRGSAAGLIHRDLGELSVEDSDDNKFQAYVDLFKWNGGLVVKDPRAIGRVANIEVTGKTNIFDEEVLRSVKNWMRDQGSTAIAYCSIDVMTQIQNAISNKSNVFHMMADPFGAGGFLPALLGSPIYVDESILQIEDAIS